MCSRVDKVCKLKLIAIFNILPKCSLTIFSSQKLNKMYMSQRFYSAVPVQLNNNSVCLVDVYSEHQLQ